MATLRLSRNDFLKKVRQLPEKPPITTALFPESDAKKVWVHWLSNYVQSGHGDLRNQRDARRIYNNWWNAPPIIWLAEASGVDRRRVEKAAKIALQGKNTKRKAEAIRQLLPWELVARRLQRSSRSINTRKHSITQHYRDEHSISKQIKDTTVSFQRTLRSMEIPNLSYKRRFKSFETDTIGRRTIVANWERGPHIEIWLDMATGGNVYRYWVGFRANSRPELESLLNALPPDLVPSTEIKRSDWKLSGKANSCLNLRLKRSSPSRLRNVTAILGFLVFTIGAGIRNGTVNISMNGVRPSSLHRW